MRASQALQQALESYVNVITMGATSRTDALRERLREIHQQNKSYFLAPVLMLAATFVVAMGLIIYGATGTNRAVVIASIFGISVIGMIRLMLSFWREKIATELLVELSELDDDVLKKMSVKLLAKMK
jgi:hypothetical protein